MTNNLKRYLGFSLLFAGLCSIPVAAQTPSGPSQAFVLEFGGSEGAAAPLDARLTVGAEFTMEVWVMRTSESGGSIMGKSHDPSGTDPYSAFALSLTSDGRPQLELSTGVKGSYRAATATNALPLRQWTHLAGTLSGGVMTLYINGTRSATATAAGKPEQSPLAFGLGEYIGSDGKPCCGGAAVAIAQASVWSRSLTAAEIAANRGHSLSGSENGLIAVWPLDEGSGTTARDLGPNRIPLKLVTSGNFLARWDHTGLLTSGPYFEATPRLMAAPFCFQNTIPCLNTGRLIDFDHDGYLDLVVTQTQGQFGTTPPRAFHNDGHGLLSDTSASVFGASPPTIHGGARDYTVADFNGDGLSDFFAAVQGPDAPPFPGGHNLLLMQHPGGQLVNELSDRMPDLIGFYHCVTTGDFTGDGAPDLYVGSIGQNPPQLLINDGKGHFTNVAAANLPSPAGDLTQGFTACAVIDVNRDGKQDLVLGSSQDQNAPRDLLLMNDGSGKFTIQNLNALPPRTTGPNGVSTDMTVADLDGDGYDDVLMQQGDAALTFSQPVLYLNNRDSTFRDASDRLPTLNVGGFIWPVDINGDGRVDLVSDYGGTRPGHPRMFLNTGSGHFVDATELLPMEMLLTPENQNFLPGDLNRDGRMDFAIVEDQDVRTVLSVKAIEAGVLSALQVQAPVIVTGVVNSATFQPGVVPGSWVSITGANFSDVTRVWTASDFNGTSLPTDLSGVEVRIGGQPAAVYYISPSQINAQAPAGISGDVPVQVIRNGVASATFTATVVPNSPGVFAYPAGDKTFAAAVFLSGTLVGDPAVTPGTQEAHSGDHIELFATGLTASAAGTIIAAPMAIEDKVTVLIGDAPAKVEYAGLVAVGEFQINIVVPDLPAGEYPVTVQVAGKSSRSGVLLPVTR
jgi:uncharacterized protein (TIGR03437 family)